LTPSQVRSVLAPFLDGEIEVDLFTDRLIELVGTRQVSQELPPELRNLFDEAKRLRDGKKPGDWTDPSLAVVKGLARELFDRLPHSDEVPVRSDEIDKLRHAASELEKKHGYRLLGIIGSVASETATPFSDVDVIVEDVGGTDHWRSFALSEDLSSILYRPVDTICLADMAPERRARFEIGMVPL
jgi:predicted nucleotidyltransferase